MATGLISKKYLIDIANAIRVMLDSESTYTPAQMATAIANIDGSITGTITKSSNADVGIITDTLLDDICDALRTQLGDNTLSFTPSQIADAILTISSGGGGSVDIVPFSSGTDEQIVAMIQAAHNGDIDLQQDGGWAVGDVRTITVGAFTTGSGASVPQQSIDIVISSFDDYNSCGCVMQFDFKDALTSITRMNSSNTNVGGYGGSEMKTTTLPALVNALPTWLKDLLITFSCLTSAGNGSSTIEAVTNNKLALRSETEVFGRNSSSLGREGIQVQYYETAANKIKKRGHDGSAYGWWERSPNYNTNGFCYVSSNGGSSGHLATEWFGVAPFGCL